jgi:hypothetical protein
MRLSFLLLAYLFFSCNSDSRNSLTEKSFDLGDTSIVLHASETISNLDIEELANPIYLQAGSHSGLIVVDSKSWQILMVSQAGDILDKAGGSGQGPGEFGVMNSIHVNENKQLITLDKRLGRIGLFNIYDNGLIFDKNITYQSPDSLTLQDIYSDGDHWFGVYESRNHINHSLYLFALNDDLNPERVLLEMPGHERTEIRGREVTNNFGKTTHWAFQGTEFYYGSSHCFCFTNFHLNTLLQDSASFLVDAKSAATEVFKKYAANRMAPVLQAYPEWNDVIDGLTILPIHSGFSVTEEYILFYPFYNGTNENPFVLGNIDDGTFTIMITDQFLTSLTRINESVFAIDAASEAEFKVVEISVK